MADPEEDSVDGMVLASITYAGRNEDELLAEYARRCRRKGVLALYGQVKSSLSRLHKLGLIRCETVDREKRVFKLRSN